MLGRFFRRGKFRPGFFFSAGENLYWYTFSGGDSIPGRFFQGKFYAGGNSMLQHRNSSQYPKG